MPTTVHFATNRVVSNPDDVVGGYAADMVAASRPDLMTYGTAFVTGVDVDNDQQGTISQINETSRGGFSREMTGDLSQPGRDVLVFVHGFANTFRDAITRAAFNREWLSKAGVAAGETTVVAFSWPSKGQIVSGLNLTGNYESDQAMAQASAAHLTAFLVNLKPILIAARKAGQRITLLAHSMGALALDAAVETWFREGEGNEMMFDLAILAAGDCGFDAFEHPGLSHLGGLSRLAGRVMICYSHGDEILQLSTLVNPDAPRLGQDGPRNRTDASEYPTAVFQMLDCSLFRDYDFSPLTSHQYYRMSPGARALIAAAMGGGMV
jgi:esterase/lipase superfamily enzyme